MVSLTQSHDHLTDKQIDWLGSAVFSITFSLLLSIIARVTHIKFAKKDLGYSETDFTSMPFYLMIFNCLAIMVIIGI
jgi:hypothetical protein